MTKRCSDCEGKKPLSEFHKNKTKPDGLQSICKVCRREKTREWRGKAKEVKPLSWITRVKVKGYEQEKIINNGL